MFYVLLKQQIYAQPRIRLARPTTLHYKLGWLIIREFLLLLPSLAPALATQ